jgi:hypothetical protein
MQQEDYYQINRISNSYLSTLKKQINQVPDKRNTEAMRFGSGLHCMLLEPHKFDHRDYTGRERLQMLDMVKAIKEYVEPEYLAGEKELEIYYSFHNVPCKLKADIVNDNMIVDIKTTGTSNPQDFLKSAIEYDYIRQGAWYLDCPYIVDADINKFVIIGVSKIKPYPVFIFELDRFDPLIEAGREEYMFLLDYLKNSEDLLKQFESITQTETIIKKAA